MTSERSSDASTADLQRALKQDDLFFESEDSYVVDWNNTHADHPRSWPAWKKTYTMVMICWLEALMTLISTSGANASTAAMETYGFEETFGYFAFISMYLLAQAVGGIIVSPFSESFGRRTLYIYAVVVFCIFNIVIAASDSFVAVFFGRFITGFVASIPATVAFGSIEDMYDAQSRIWIVYAYTASGNTGLVLGSIYAAYISRAIGWRWIFWIAAIASAVSFFFALGMDESRATSLLARKVKAIKKSSGQSQLKTASEGSKVTVSSFVTHSIYRPLFFLVTEPLVIFCSILCSIAFALFYAATEVLTLVYTSPKLSPQPFDETNSSLAFIALLIGILLDAIPRIWDIHVYHRSVKSRKPLLPEAKIGGFAVAAPALAVGLWWWGWLVPPHDTTTHWVVSMIGLVLIGFAGTDFAVVLFGYITESYGPYAASATATLSFTRTIAAAVIPLFITQMYTAMGANKATTVFAAIATPFAFTPILFFTRGAELRRKSQWAQSSKEEEEGEEDTSHGFAKDGFELGPNMMKDRSSIA